MGGLVRVWLALAGLNGFMAVAAGAFGAHGVRNPELKALLHTGSQYQAVHAAAALACVALLPVIARPATWAGWLFGLGAMVFGGSLYLLAFTGVRLWGAVTPIGGLLLLAGWAAVIWGALAATGAAQG